MLLIFQQLYLNIINSLQQILMKQIVYSIEGNIGSGKTVLLHLLSKRIPNLNIAPQPLADWQHISKYNLLQIYYDDPNRWAYTFQNYALLTRSNHLHALLKTPFSKNELLFSERSIQADKEIFAKLLHRQGKITDMEHSLYLRFYQDLRHLYQLPILHKHIYLRADPKCCWQRIKKRGRSQETSIDLSYLNALHQMHQEWLGKGQNLVIDGSQEFEGNEQKLKNILDQILQWIGNNRQTL